MCMCLVLMGKGGGEARQRRADTGTSLETCTSWKLVPAGALNQLANAKILRSEFPYRQRDVSPL